MSASSPIDGQTRHGTQPGAAPPSRPAAPIETAEQLGHLLGVWDFGVEVGSEHFLADLLGEAA